MKHKKFDYSKHSLFIFISVLLICGFILGLFLSKYIEIKDTNNMNYYLSILIDETNPKSYFTTQFMIGSITILSIALLGTSIIGIPFIAFLIFTKGLQVGYSCALFLLTYSYKGIIGILIVFLPQITIDLITFYFISHFSLLFSINLIYGCTNKKCIPIKTRLNKMLNVLLLTIILIIVSSYFKSTVSIGLIKLFKSL